MGMRAIQEIGGNFLRNIGLAFLVLVIGWMAIFRFAPARYSEAILSWTNDSLETMVIYVAQAANWPDQP
jgi:hypothetical protein